MGDRIGPYEVTGELGRGAMAIVRSAVDPKLQRAVALKEPLVPAGLGEAEAAQYRALLLREACIAARLNHPNIVSIFAAEEYDGRPIIAMELLEGATLDRVIRTGRPTLQTTFKVIEQTLEAVAYAHEQGVVHRDIKPQNLFVTKSGIVKLTDFGIARFPQGTLSLAPVAYAGTIAVQGSILGTPGYMSPEQVRGEDVDGRTDLFAVGVVAHEMLSGANPFGSLTGTALTTIMYRIANVEVPSVAALDPSVPQEMSDAIEAALRKNVAERVSSARDLLEMWRRASTAVGVNPRETGIALDLSPECPPTMLEMPPAATVLDVPTVAVLADVAATVAPVADREPQQSVGVTEAAEEAAGVVPEPETLVAATVRVKRPAKKNPPPAPDAHTETVQIAATLPTRTIPAERIPQRRRRGGLIAAAIVVVVVTAAIAALGTRLARPEAKANAVVEPNSPVAAPATPTISPVDLSLRAKKSRIYAGSKATLIGSIEDTSGAAVFGATVELKRNEHGEWKTIGRLTTTSSGFTFSVKPKKTTSYRLVFSGDALHKAGQSAVVKVSVRTRPAKKRTAPSRGGTTPPQGKADPVIPPWGTAN